MSRRRSNENLNPGASVYDTLASPWDLTASVLGRLLSHATTVRLGKNGVLCSPGDSAGTLYYVMSGSVGVMANEGPGKEWRLDTVHAGSFLGEVGLFVPAPRREVTIRALEATEVACWEDVAFEALLLGPLAAEAAIVVHALATQIAKRLLETRRRANGLALLDLRSRVRRALVELCAEPGAVALPGATEINVLRQDLAKRVGCSREAAGRIVQKLEEEGLVTCKGRRIIITHAARLATTASALARSPAAGSP